MKRTANLIESTRCTALRSSGRFCDGESLPDAPFPICVHCAALVLRFLNSHIPQTSEDKAIAIARAARQERNRRAPAEAQAERQSTVYYLRVGALIKIGRTDNLPRRLGQYPPDSVLLAVEQGGEHLERRRHREFADDLRHGNEWFHPSPALVAHIAEVKRQRAA